ncbi:hypothetical protein C8Q74DRAFT_1294540 [Fomes fomentarius]|nr:hypothetical protein C8Q74DRAFT_1294540 [Fomes fomentarius]
MLSALALHLETGYLQQLHVKISCRDSIRVLGGLLAGPASQIVELKIDNPSLYIIEDEEHQDWNDLLDQHWSLLNLSACTRLENLSLNVAMPLKAAAFPLCAAPAKLIQQVSKTLKKVTFYVDVITMPEALSNRRLTKLQALDKVLSDPAKLPRFESLELHLRLCPITLVDRDRFRAKAIAGCKKALRNLHASERLTIEASINDIVLISSTEGGSI